MLHRFTTRTMVISLIVSLGALLCFLPSCTQGIKKSQQAETSKRASKIPCERDTFWIYNDNTSLPGIRETLDERMAGHWQGRDSVAVYEEIWHTDSVVRKAKWFVLDTTGRRICIDVFVYDIYTEF